MVKNDINTINRFNSTHVNLSAHTIELLRRSHTQLSINAAIKYALNTFIFSKDSDRNIIQFKQGNDFSFTGNLVLFRHIIYKLLQYSLNHTRKSIKISTDTDKHCVYFKYSPGGTVAFFDDDCINSDLYFCHSTMDNFKGSISVKSNNDSVTFTLNFPKATQ